MSDKHLSKIESTLETIARQQGKILARLDQLEAASRKTNPVAVGEVVAFLDGFRANEALGEASLGAWIAVSTDACLRGGLRTVQCREGMHARLLEQRIKELGHSPKAEVPEAVHTAAMAGAASTDTTDAEKVLKFMQSFPDADAALAPIFEMADRLVDDPETASLLRTIAQDEQSTLAFFADACAQLNG